MPRKRAHKSPISREEWREREDRQDLEYFAHRKEREAANEAKIARLRDLRLAQEASPQDAVKPEESVDTVAQQGRTSRSRPKKSRARAD